VLWGFITRYAPGATPENHPTLDALVGYAINYYRDFVKPFKIYRQPTDQERAAMEDLLAALEAMDPGLSGTDIQNQVYEIGKTHEFENLRDWFKALYEVLFGQSQGPRFGSFAALYGVSETAALVRRALAGDDLSAE
jgi:lysyl-tRNA synthetase class 1